MQKCLYQIIIFLGISLITLSFGSNAEAGGMISKTLTPIGQGVKRVTFSNISNQAHRITMTCQGNTQVTTTPVILRPLETHIQEYPCDMRIGVIQSIRSDGKTTVFLQKEGLLFDIDSIVITDTKIVSEPHLPHAASTRLP